MSCPHFLPFVATVGKLHPAWAGEAEKFVVYQKLLRNFCFTRNYSKITKNLVFGSLNRDNEGIWGIDPRLG